MSKTRILVTGACGYIAAQILPALRERYDCVLVDARETDRGGSRVAGVRVADLTRSEYGVHRPLFDGVQAVVHLAYLHPPGGQGSGTADSFRTERRNVDMAFHVYQLALETGVRRVVVASSNHAADWYEGLIHAKQKELVDPHERAVSDNFYGWAKETYEHLGFVYAAGRLGRPLEVVQVRIGAPRDLPPARYENDPVRYRRDLGAWISPRDLAQLFVRSLDAGDIRDEHGIPFQIFYGISDNARKFWSLANARRVIGYAPEDDSEVRYAEDIRRLLGALGGPVPAREFNPGPGG